MEAATKIISKCYCFPLDENLNFLDFQDVDYFQFFSLVIYIRSYSRYIKGRSEACCPRSSLLVPIKERYSFNINKQRVVLNASQEIQTTEYTLNRRRRMVANLKTTTDQQVRPWTICWSCQLQLPHCGVGDSKSIPSHCISLRIKQDMKIKGSRS